MLRKSIISSEANKQPKLLCAEWVMKGDILSGPCWVINEMPFVGRQLSALLVIWSLLGKIILTPLGFGQDSKTLTESFIHMDVSELGSRVKGQRSEVTTH